MATRTAGYPEAAAALQRMASPDTENEAVRNTAEALSVLAEWRDAGRSGWDGEMLSAIHAGLVSISSSVGNWFWLGPAYGSPFRILGCVPDATMGIGRELNAKLLSASDSRSGPLRFALPGLASVVAYSVSPAALEARPGMPGPSVMDKVLSGLDGLCGEMKKHGSAGPFRPSESALASFGHAIAVAVQALATVEAVMGPRDEAKIRALESAVSDIPRRYGRLRSSEGSYLAFPTDEAAALLRQEAREALRGLPRVEDRSSPAIIGSGLRIRVDRTHSKAVLYHDGCWFSTLFPATESIAKAVSVLQNCAHEAEATADDPGAQAARIDRSEAVPEDLAVEVNRALWHLARSRSGPNLWR